MVWDMSEMFDSLTKSIRNVASKMDLVLFGSDKKDQELIGDVVSLQCFYIAVYRQPSKILDGFMTRLAEAKAPTAKQKKDKKSSGSYFTPPYIADYMVKSTIGPLKDKFQKGRKPVKPETKIKKLLSLRICDPAVGGGIFLVVAHDFLMTEILKLDPKADLAAMSREAAKCLFGVDINPEAVEGCKLALHLNIAKWELKNHIDAFASTADMNSSLQKSSSDKSEKQPTARGRAPAKTSTKQTTAQRG